MLDSQCPDYKASVILISNLTFSTHPPRSQFTLSLQPQAVALSLSSPGPLPLNNGVPFLALPRTTPCGLW